MVSVFPAAMRYAGPKERSGTRSAARTTGARTSSWVATTPAWATTTARTTPRRSSRFEPGERHHAADVRALVLVQPVRGDGVTQDVPARRGGARVVVRDEGPRDAPGGRAPTPGVLAARGRGHPDRRDARLGLVVRELAGEEAHHELVLGVLKPPPGGGPRARTRPSVGADRLGVRRVHEERIRCRFMRRSRTGRGSGRVGAVAAAPPGSGDPDPELGGRVGASICIRSHSPIAPVSSRRSIATFRWLGFLRDVSIHSWKRSAGCGNGIPRPVRTSWSLNSSFSGASAGSGARGARAGRS